MPLTFTPQLILITDSIPTADGGGISQTLFNLFDNWPGKISMIVADDEVLPQGKTLDATIYHFRFDRFKGWNNRFGKWVNPYLKRKNLQHLLRHSITIPGLPAPADATILVSTTVPIKLYLAARLQSTLGYRVVPYFMDDWLWQNDLKWRGGNIKQVARQLLDAAPAWLMISRALEQTLVMRYQLTQKPSLVVHNPAALTELLSDSFFVAEDPASFEIIYAGSIWPMHLDALVATAKAIDYLHSIGKTGFSLIIYCAPDFWKYNVEKLQFKGVSYGGFLEYKQLPECLNRAWLLLVASSFDSKYAAFTRSSIQTKATDYMSIGKPLLYVGPADGASGTFVEEQHCGFCIHSNNPHEIAEQLLGITTDEGKYKQKAENGMLAARTTFSKQVVQEKLYSFLSAIG